MLIKHRHWSLFESDAEGNLRSRHDLSVEEKKIVLSYDELQYELEGTHLITNDKEGKDSPELNDETGNPPPEL